VPQKVKQARANGIMKVQKEISLQHNKSLIGKILKVLIDRKEVLPAEASAQAGDYFIGRTEFDSPEVDNEVYINCGPRLSGVKQSLLYLRMGDFVNVKITGAKEYDLEGVVINSSDESI
jgi:ribosomal protein S12 methylthiotransferase